MTNIRNITFALTALAAIGAANFATSSADARSFAGGFHGGGRVTMGASRPSFGGMRTASFHPSFTYHGGNQMPQHNWPTRTGCGYGGNCGMHVSNWPVHHAWYPRPQGYPSYTPSYTPSYAPTYAAPSYAPPAPVYSAPAPASAPTYAAPAAYTPTPAAGDPCTCLHKDYTPDGQIVMQDVCTHEVLSGPVSGNQQAQAPAPYPQQQ